MTEAELVTGFVELVYPMKSAESSVALHVGKNGPSWTCAGWIDGNLENGNGKTIAEACADWESMKKPTGPALVAKLRADAAKLLKQAEEIESA